MILGIGNDIVSVERIENLLDKFGERFIKKVFTKDERTRSLKNLKPAASLAKRFAAKEAAWKALGDEKQIGINWKDMEVRNNKSGKPFLELTGKAAEQLKKLTPENRHQTEGRGGVKLTPKTKLTPNVVSMFGN